MEPPAEPAAGAGAVVGTRRRGRRRRSKTMAMKGEKVPCEELRMYLYSVENYRKASMLRKGREVHKVYCDVHKGGSFLDDRFSLTQFGQMVLDNGTVRAGRARNVRHIVVARETLYCSGTGSCKRGCGGFGQCVPGCNKQKVRGHKCSFRVKLTMRLGFVNNWFVEVLGAHNTYTDEPDPAASDMARMMAEYNPHPLPLPPRTIPTPERGSPAGSISSHPSALDSRVPSFSNPPVAIAVVPGPAPSLGIPVFPDYGLAASFAPASHSNGNAHLPEPEHEPPLDMTIKSEPKDECEEEPMALTMHYANGHSDHREARHWMFPRQEVPSENERSESSPLSRETESAERSSVNCNSSTYSNDMEEEEEMEGEMEEDYTMEEEGQEMEDSDGAEGSQHGEELMCRVRQLEASVLQLRNVVEKRDGVNTKAIKEKNAREFDFNKYNVRHVALKIAYLGWNYQGFVVQEDTAKTVESVLFEALLRTRLVESRETSNYNRCGRTDKGVSALGQVISLDLRTNLLTGPGVKQRPGGTAHLRPGDKSTEIRYVHILNRVLPPEIRVLAWAPVEETFSARFSCTRRTYKYFFPKGNLDLLIMSQACEKLVGEHDFRNFCKPDASKANPTYHRRILSAEIRLLDQQDSGFQMCELTIVGNAFLWHQIRCIVSVLFLIGQGKEHPRIIDDLLDITKMPRKPQYPIASELPLVLYDCEYADDVEWVYEADWHEDNIRQMQQMWAQHSIRATMLRSMLEHMDRAKVETDSDIAPWNELSAPVQQQNEWMIPGSKPRVYRPLLLRPTCESVEERVEHQAKRRKMAQSGSSQSAAAAAASGAGERGAGDRGEPQSKRRKTAHSSGSAPPGNSS